MVRGGGKTASYDDTWIRNWTRQAEGREGQVKSSIDYNRRVNQKQHNRINTH